MPAAIMLYECYKFGFNKWESVSAILLGLGRLNIDNLIMLRKVRFYRHLLHSCDIFTGSIARSASRRYLIYSEADSILIFFAPQGRHVAPIA